jgi:hypothetical protein
MTELMTNSTYEESSSMSPRYRTASSFRQALEERLRLAAMQRNVPLADLRQKMVMERLLDRLFASPALPVSPASPWLLKGGFALDLRYRPHARATRDLDLSVASLAADSDPQTMQLTHVFDELQRAAALHRGDFFEFRIGPAKQELQAAPGGGARFPVVAMLDGREFVRFSVDVGIGDVAVEEPEALEGDSFFDFAEIPVTRVLAVPRSQQCAEKLHAYTFPWHDRINTRVKDLVDLVLLIERGQLDKEKTRMALHATFARRATHPLPTSLSSPPPSWQDEFTALASQAQISTRTTNEAFVILRDWYTHVMQGQ